MKQIIPFLKPYRGRIAIAMLLVATATMCDLLLPTIMSNILNNGIRNSDMDYVVRCCGLMLAVMLLGFGSLICGRWISCRVVANFNGDIRSRVFNRVNYTTFEEFNRIGTAALITRSTHDVDTVSWVASMVSGSLITIPVLLIGGIGLAMSKDVALSLIMLVSVPFVFVIVVLVGRNIGPLHRESDRYIDIQNDLMRSRLHGIRVIRAFNKEPEEHEKVAEATKTMAEYIIRANVRMGGVSPLAVFILNMAVLFIIFFGGVRIENGVGALTGGDVFAIVQYIALTANGVLMAGMTVVMLPHAQVAADRIGEVLNAQVMAEPNVDEEMDFTGDIVFDHVSFRYEGSEEAALSDVSFHIRPGEKIAIIGGTGSGKSSLLQMLMSFRLPSGGRIYFDGVPADTIKRRVIRKNISCVLQKTAVYTGTIRHNIEMGKPDATDEEIRAAADIAQLTDFVGSLPDGFEHELAEAGKNLSGGQKQRLCIARAVLKDAPIYIFDDSFSALDFLTEAKLRTRLNEKIAGKTQIVITQRITSAMRSDCIYVMDKGRIVDFGTHDKLMESCDIYREIYASQTGGERK